MTPKLYKQIFSILNAATNYNVGGENITITDVNGMVSLGEKVENSVDLRKSFLNGLLPVIGRITSYAMGLRRETRGIEKTPIEFGAAVLEYERYKIARAKQNTAWVKPQVNPFAVQPEDDTDFTATVYSVISGYQINKVIYDYQLYSAFRNMSEMSAFLSMIYQDMYDGMTEKMNEVDALTECTAIGQSLLATTWRPKKQTAFNLWTLFKRKFPSSTLNFSDCRNDTFFLKFCGAYIREKIRDAYHISNLFNVGGAEKQLDNDYRVHVLGSFASDMSYYLEADTFHNELVSLPNYEEITAWQGLGGDSSYEEKSKIAVNCEDVTVVQSGIVAHVFSPRRMATMIDRINTESQRNSAAKCTDIFHSADIGQMIRRNDIGMVFYISETDFDNNFLKTLTFDVDEIPESETYGKTESELQTDIHFIGNSPINVYGELNYVTDYEGYSSDETLQSGNYLALRISLFGIPENVEPTITVQKKVGEVTNDPVTLDLKEMNDNSLYDILVVRIPDNTTTLTVSATASGYTTITKTLDFVNLDLKSSS